MIRLLAVLFALVLSGEAAAATYWVSTAGNDGNGCTDSASPLTTTAKATVAAGAECLTAAGDTLNVRVGTYVGVHLHDSVTTVPSGNSWSVPVTIKAYSNETVTLTNVPALGAVVRVAQNNLQYISFENLILDATGGSEGIYIGPGTGGDAQTPHHIRFKNFKVKNAPHNCVQVDLNSHHNWFTADIPAGSKVHDCSTDIPPGGGTFYGFYVSDDDSIYENIEVYDIATTGSFPGLAFHLYPSPDRITVRNIYAHNTGGILAFDGDGNMIYNNIVVNGQYGVIVGGSTTNTSVYNNTAYNNSQFGIDAQGSTGTIIRNNILFNNSLGGVNPGGSTVQSNSYCNSGCTGTGTINSGSNPFVNAAAGNFGLIAGSLAIDAGTPVAGRLYNGTAPDIGAHETIGVNTCSASGNTLTLAFYNALNPPIIFPSVVGSTLLVDGTLRTLSAPNVVNNQVTMTFSGAAFQTTASYSYATTGIVTDSAWIGGANNQRLNAVNNFSCGGVAPPQLVAWYKFEELSGTAPQDSSVNGLHGSFDGNVAYTASGRVGRGLSFPTDGTGTMTVPDNDLLDLDTFSVMAWVRPNTQSSVFRTVLAKNYVYFLYSAIGDAYCGVGFPLGGADNGFTQDVACHASALPAASWTHLALTRSESTLTLYRDGVSVATAPVTVPAGTSSGTLQIGGSQFGERFEGILDEVKVYSGVRSQAEIVQDMASVSTLATFKFGDKTVKLGDKTIKIGN